MNTRKEISANTNALKATIAAMQEGGKDRRFTPYTGSWSPEKGGYKLNRGDGTLTQLPQDAQAVADKNARAGGARTQVAYDKDGNAVLVNKDDATSRPITAPGGTAPLKKNDFEPDVQKFGKDIQFVSTMPADLETLRRAPENGRAGMGPIAGMVPSIFVGEQANQNRQAAQRLMNTILYMNSGKAINEQEMVRQRVGRGITQLASDATFGEGVKALEREIKDSYRVMKAKYRPEAIQRLRERGGMSHLAEFDDASATPSTIEEAMALPRGTTFIIPEGPNKGKTGRVP
jgi:hypothetical protein